MTREALERAGQELWTDTELLPDFVGTDGDDVLTPKSAGVTWGMDGDDILVSEDNGHLNILIGGDGDDIYVIEPGSVSFIQDGHGHDKLDVSSFAGRDNPFILMEREYRYDTAYSTTSTNSSSEEYISFLYDPITKTTIGYHSSNDLSGPNETFGSIIYGNGGNGGNSYSSYHQDWVFEWPTIPQLYLYRNTDIESLPAKAWGYLNELTSQEFYATGNPKIYVSTSNYYFYNSQKGLGRLVAEINIVDKFYDQILNQLSPDLPDPQAFELETSPTIKLTLGENDTFIHQGSRISLPLIHTIDYTDDKSTGVSANIFYDSSVLTLPSAANRFVNQVTTAGSIINEGVTEEGILIYENSLHDDTEDLDNNPSTDKFLNVTWGDISGKFPNIAGDELGILTFNTADELVDPITGEKTTTTVNVIPSGVPTGYQALNSSINFTPFEPRFSLDVDGDGTANAFSDGLMIIRKLLNYAFEGDALTNKAISPEATRTTTEIHEYIQSGIDDLSLDIDKDGTVNPFSDGLMIIRAMLGNAFQGSALTDKALSVQSPYAVDSSPWDSVKQNINELMPPDQPLA